MPDNARTWVYQSSREFSDSEIDWILSQGQQFIANWDYHGERLHAAFNVLYNRFIILMVDEQTASAGGCSIDKSVALIKAIEREFNVNMLDRLTLAYLNSDATVDTVHVNNLTELHSDGKISDSTIVFSNMITSFGELKRNWRIPLIDSWAGNRLKVS